MTTLITADLHFSPNPRDAYRNALMKTLPNLTQKLKVDEIIILGDLTEEKYGHSEELVNAVADFIYNLAKVSQVIIDQGNHDWYSSPETAFFRFLGKFKNVMWVDSPTPVAKNSIFLPHSANPERDWRDINFKKFDIVFAHQHFAGAVGDNGSIIPGGTPLSFFPKNVRIISGDIHRPQTIGPLTYVGAPYTIDFGDTFEPRMLLLENNGNLKSIKMTGPQKVLVEVDNIADLKHEVVLEQDIVKVRVGVSPEEAVNWSAIEAEVRAWANKQGVVLHAITPIVTAKTGRMSKKKASASRTDEHLMKDYGKVRDIDEGTLNVGMKML